MSEQQLVNYKVVYTYANGKWRAHAESPTGELEPYSTPGGRQFPGGYATLTACMDGVRSIILDHHSHARRDAD